MMNYRHTVTVRGTGGTPGAAGQRMELVNTNLSKEQEARLHDVFAE